MTNTFVRTCITMVFSLVTCGAASAQTIIISPTSAFTWGPSSDDAATFGTPPVPVLTNYQANLFLKAAVTGTTEPTTPPALIVSLGKPTPDANGVDTSTPIKSMIQPGIEYVMFLHAVGPGGISASGGSVGPFGFPPPPKATVGAVGITK